ncbi:MULTISPECIES: SelT/SelW/SelH family protein [unclassified Pedobacter]|uniref:SelT/SelW/SelH family protein n=1 Tax=Pedobacter TaxID=84567 RepID=UPI000B4BD018|nr:MULTISPECIES: SelT/SelW/SelH family protein [unclassified Pedobacter]MCX2433468.1 SelT/SelW/SelH family protein [Pedobacter sp. GR22-10]OWK68900.1 SelT/selW/selH selenoprotein [Pedobacter sp. AJM]
MLKPLISIEYCPRCGWLLRSAYMAQELLTTFSEQLKGVSLLPSEVSGTFQIRLNNAIIFDRREAGRFPEIKELKKLVRDQIDPEMNLGHTDR